MKLVEVIGTSTLTGPNGTTEQEETKLGLTIEDDKPTAEVSFETGFTLNLGNYQSARIHVGLKIPSNLDADSLDKSYEFVKNWVDVKLTAAIMEAKNNLK